MSTTGPAILAIGHLHELWVHTGTACNLSCPFCHEGSKPGDTRIAAPNLAQLAPLLDQAAARGVQRFAFTGGEPLILKGILDILLHALRLAPALVLTNGTAPFIRRAHQLAQLRAAPHALSFRVSIDWPDETRHDAGRGLRNFRKALEGLKLLHAAGFAVGITRQIAADEDAASVAAQFRQLLRRQRLPEDLPIVALPELGALGGADAATAAPVTVATDSGRQPDDVAANQDRLGNASSRLPATAPACTRSRMVLLRAGALRFHACPLTDDAPRFDAGATLDAALAARVTPDHPRCALCLAAPGVDYIGAAAARGPCQGERDAPAPVDARSAL